jgi:hypothetical protein
MILLMTWVEGWPKVSSIYCHGMHPQIRLVQRFRVGNSSTPSSVDICVLGVKTESQQAHLYLYILSPGSGSQNGINTGFATNEKTHHGGIIHRLLELLINVFD